MIIDFEKIAETELKNFYGGEKSLITRVFSDESNRIMRSRLAPSASIGLHKHEAGSEIIYFLKGNGKVICDGQEYPITAGQAHYCEKGHEHSLINNSKEDLDFFAVVCKQ